jgi:hypothetical protein
MSVKRPHLQRDLGWGAAAAVLIAVTTVRPGEALSAYAALLDHRSATARLRRWARARVVRVSMGERQRVTCAYPTEGRGRHSRRAWDTQEGSAGRVERARQRSARPVSSFTWFYASSTTATSSVATTTTTNPTSSNRSLRK